MYEYERLSSTFSYLEHAFKYFINSSKYVSRRVIAHHHNVHNEIQLNYAVFALIDHVH